VPVIVVSNNDVEEITTFADEIRTIKSDEGWINFLKSNQIESSFMKIITSAFYNSVYNPPRKPFDYYTALVIHDTIKKKTPPVVHKAIHFNPKFGATIVSSCELSYSPAIDEFTSKINIEPNVRDNAFNINKKLNFGIEITKLLQKELTWISTNAGACIFVLEKKTNHLSLDYTTLQIVDPPEQHFKAIGISIGNKTRPYVATDKSTFDRGDTQGKIYWPKYVYDPIMKTNPVWADKEDTQGIKFHQIDGKVDRCSYHGRYELVPYIYRHGRFDSGSFPVNPVGKTGITGRGQLGKWGPNHAADPIVTTIREGKLYFVSIKRKDNGHWALPGGMVEPGDNISITIKKEFAEEAMNSLTMDQDRDTIVKQQLDDLFRDTTEVYRGYVDDPRNTDNSWMETVAAHVHINESNAEKYKLEAGDDAGKVKWKEFTDDITLYASHKQFVENAVKHLVEINTPDLPSWIKTKYIPRQFPDSTHPWNETRK
jgi:ADP-ribose pyrophosphatase